MKVMQINSIVNTRNSIVFRESDEWGAGRPDPWLIEEQRINDEFISKQNELSEKLFSDEISWHRYRRELILLKQWADKEKASIAEKWHKLSVNYKPIKKNFFQKLFKL